MRSFIAASLLAFLTAAPSPPKLVSPVVVELFTSQGCSSCPAADALLSELAADPSLRGAIVPLAFHVDYWNHIGWTDPFSSARWSERQRQYAAALHSSTVYTPEIVIGGRAEAVGSDQRRVRALIDAARRESSIAAITAHGRAGANGLRIDAEVTMRGAMAGGARPVLLFVLFENGGRTNVTRGENHGRQLTNDRVVRELSETRFVAAAGGVTKQTATLHLEASWARQHLGVAVLLQDSVTKAIYGAAVGEAN